MRGEERGWRYVNGGWERAVCEHVYKCTTCTDTHVTYDGTQHMPASMHTARTHALMHARTHTLT